MNKTVTRRTTVLVAGSVSGDNGQPQATEKLAEARRLQAAGQRLAIIDQQQVERLLSGDRSVQLPDLAATPAVDAYALADDRDIAPQRPHLASRRLANENPAQVLCTLRRGPTTVQGG